MDFDGIDSSLGLKAQGAWLKFKAQGWSSRLEAQGWRLKTQGCGLLAVRHRRANVCFWLENSTDLRACEDLGKATGSQNQHHDTKDSHKLDYLRHRSVYIVAARRILEGEQDYGDQTLATPTLPRLYFLRGLVHPVLVSVKVQCEKSECIVQRRKVVYTKPRSTLAHNKQHSDYVLHCFARARIAFHKIKSSALTE